MVFVEARLELEPQLEPEAANPLQENHQRLTSFRNVTGPFRQHIEFACLRFARKVDWVASLLGGFTRERPSSC